MNPLLNCVHVTKSFGSFTALSDLSFQIYPGRIVGLLGPNGSGKSTFMKLASGLLTLDQGEITIHGHAVGIKTKKIVSYLPERTYLDEWTKVSALIDYFGDFYKDFNKNKAYEMLQCLCVSPKESLKTMSKGTKEKVQLILVMSRDAMLYLLDEP
ncbi:ABC transporter ATP-binding protein, partial [bacterium 1XD42-8]